MDYFISMTTSFLDVALTLGKLLALVGILWSCVQLAFGTLETRKFITGTITKFIFFFLCLSLFPAFSKGLKTFAIELSTKVSGSSLSSTTQRLIDFMQEIEEVSNQKLSEVVDQKEILSQRITKLKEMKSNANNLKNMNPEYIRQQNVYMENAISNLEKEQQELARQIEAAGSNPAGANRTYNAIRSVLIVDDTSVAGKYRMDLEMKDPKGQGTGYISPNALLRVSLLAAQIMWQKEWNDDVIPAWEEKDKAGFFSRTTEALSISKFPFSKIFEIILCFITEILIVVVTITTLIQYVMCIIEYSICSSFSIILIPCLLFDGMKDMVQKILPSLFAQAVKLSMIVICMFFCADTYLDLAIDTIASKTPFDINQFAYVLFTLVLVFALCSNAPKLAVTLLSGQPQMSMGEFVQAAGAMVAGAKLGSSAVSHAKEGAQKGISKASNFLANRIGDVAAMKGASHGAQAGIMAAAKEHGGVADAKALKKAGRSAANGELMSRTGRRVQSKMSDMAHYSGKKGGFGGGSSGRGENQFNLRNNKISKDNPNFNNMNFGNATNTKGQGASIKEYSSRQAQMANRSYYSKYYNKANKAPMPNASLNQSFSGNNGSAKPALPQSNNSNKLPSPGLPEPKN